jgi:hypothetical protein
MTARTYHSDLRALADWLENSAVIRQNSNMAETAAWGDKLMGWSRAVRRALAALDEHSGRRRLQEHRDRGYGYPDTEGDGGGTGPF